MVRKVVKFASSYVYQGDDNNTGSSESTNNSNNNSNNANNNNNNKDLKKQKEKVEQPKADVNVMSLLLGQLTENAGQKIITGDPEVCSKCKGIMSSISKLKAESNGQVWTCEFCLTPNVVNLEQDEIPKSDDLDYMLEPAPTKKEADDDDTMVIFCIDTSGSMCVTSEIEVVEQPKQEEKKKGLFGFSKSPKLSAPAKKTIQYVSRLASVQSAVASQIEALHGFSPKRRLGIVTFNDEVQIIGDGSSDPVIIAGDKLKNQEQLEIIGKGAQMDKGIGVTKAPLLKKLSGLEEQGGTALGPALVVSCAMAATRPGSKVILCTDGLANVGLGAIDEATDSEKTAISAFYQQIGDSAKENGIIVSVITIAGTECSMENLGKIADATGGQVEIVDPAQMTSNFNSIVSNQVIATNVQVTLVAHPAVVFSSGSNTQTIDVGNINSDTETIVDFSLKPVPVDQTGLPFQVQIVYRRTAGPKCVRVITSVMPVTRDRKTAEKDVDVLVIGVHVSKKCAALVQEGKYDAVRENFLVHKEMLDRSVHTKEQRELLKQFDAQMNMAEGELKFAAETEAMAGLDLSNISEGSERFYEARSNVRSDRTAKVMYQMKGREANACVIQ